MKITKITTTVVNAKMRNWVVVRVYTDAPGLIGIGEATLEFQTRAVVGAVEDLASLLIGRDPREIERNWQILYRHPFFKGGAVTMSAISGIDQALWDISAKDLNVPLWRILGGLARDRVRMYDHLGGGNSDAVYNSDTVNSFEEKMKQSIDDGFTAVKILAVPQSAPLGDAAKLRHAGELMATARKTAGPDVDIMIDFHGRTTAAMAIQYAEVLAPYNPLFLEEIVPPEQHEALKRAREKIKVPLATGERLLHRSEFLPLLEDGLIDVAQPDVQPDRPAQGCGGVWQGRRPARPPRGFPRRPQPRDGGDHDGGAVSGSGVTGAPGGFLDRTGRPPEDGCRKGRLSKSLEASRGPAHCPLARASVAKHSVWSEGAGYAGLRPAQWHSGAMCSA